VVPGDGIGKEVMPPAIRVLDAVGAKFGFGFAYQHFDWSCETYRATGRMMPEDGAVSACHRQ
jgi:tartrate dehydrogenase/decarboxylase/D-malate dehydrogenase